MHDGLKEVYFGQYCPSCKHFGVPEELEPCSECVEVAANVESHKPVRWEEKE